MRIISFFLAFIVCLLASSEIKLNGGLLWKISGNGLTKPSYIFGTYHLMHYQFLDSVPRFYDCYDSVEQVVGEIQMDSTNLRKSMSDYVYSNKIKMPRDTTYDHLFSANELLLVDSVFLKYIGCKSNQVFAKPDFMMNILFFKLMGSQSGVSTANYNEFLDAYLTNSQAKLKGLNRLSLETVSAQMDLLFGQQMNLNDGAKALIRFIKYDLSQMRPDYQMKVLLAYRKQDLDLLATMNIDSCANGNQNLMDKFGKYRNIEWMKKLPSIIQSKPTMIVVGAFHLCHEYGLINEFRKLGYTVEPIKKDHN